MRYPNSNLNHQKGVALYIVIVMLFLSMLLALWASRTSIFSEMVTGNDADYQRAFDAAQVMIQDATDDIYNNTYKKNSAAIRKNNTTLIPNYETYTNWISTLEAQSSGCKDGVCLPRLGAQNFWDDEAELEKMLAVGARYKTYSAPASNQNIPNPILTYTDANKGAWYWIEPIPMAVQDGGSMASVIAGSGQAKTNIDMIYRVTSIAFGIKGSGTSTDIADRPKTMAVIQTLLAMPADAGE